MDEFLLNRTHLMNIARTTNGIDVKYFYRGALEPAKLIFSEHINNKSLWPSAYSEHLRKYILGGVPEFSDRQSALTWFIQYGGVVDDTPINRLKLSQLNLKIIYSSSLL